MNGAFVVEQSLDPEIEAAERFVTSIAGASQLPAFVENVRSISSVAANLQVRVQLLETEIVKDAALTGRVLRIAKALGQSSKICSVKQAIFVLGYDRVTNLAASAAVFDKLERGAEEVQDLLAMSILTANQGLCLAIEARNARPELVYLCGLFSNLGELMAACYRKTQYREWVATRKPESPRPDGTEARHFGFAFETVAVMLAKQWGLPGELAQSMKRLPPPPRETSRDRLLYLAQFGNELTRALYAAPQTDEPNPAVEALIGVYAGPLHLDRRAISRAIAEARRESVPVFRQMQLTIDGWRRARLKAAEARAAEARVAEAPDRAVDDLFADESTAQPHPTGEPSSTQAEPTAMATPRPTRPAAGKSLSETTTLALTAGIGAGYTRGVLALSNEAFTQVHARIGLGDGHDTLLKEFVIHTAPATTPLAAALASRTDLFVDMDDKSDPLSARYRHDPTLRAAGARCFVLLPLVLAGRLIGTLYFDSALPMESSQEGRVFLSGARSLLLAAFARHRAPALAS